jgi:Tfp pilus assembly protein PilN
MSNKIAGKEAPSTTHAAKKGNFLTRPIGTSKSKPAKTHSAKSAVRATLLGAAPRADLLPPEIFVEHKQRARQRSLWLGVAGAVLIAVVGTGAAFVYNVTAAATLLSVQDETLQLQSELSAHSEVRDIKENVATSMEARRVGGSTDIDWKTYLNNLQATLPGGVAITSVVIETGSPIVDYAQPTVPLEGARVGTLTFEATSPSLPSIPSWLDGLETLEGFVDAVPNSVNVVEDGSYTVSITMHINADAYSGRFAPEEKAE